MKYGLSTGSTANLNQDQVEQLQRFLDDNPDLREEFSELNSLNVKPSQRIISTKRTTEKIFL